MENSLQTDLCVSPSLGAAAGDLLELAAGLTEAETLFIAKRTETGMQTLMVWGKAREGIRAGDPLELPDRGASQERGITVPLPFLCGAEQGVVGAIRSGTDFGSGEEQSLKRAASVIARLAESEQKGTAAKREEELRRSREEAERSARHTGELLAMMGHEIRTPMNGIVAMSQLLRETGLTDEQQQYLQIIEDSQQSLLELVGSILDYGKLEARQMKLELAPMDLIGALEDTVYQFAAKAAQSPEVELTLDLDLDSSVMLIGDVQKIRQIVGNLLSNAIKFTAAGEIRVSARRLEGESGDRAWIEFAVRDTGIGISEAGIARLFQDYAQVHRPEEGDYGGTGLGLSISKRLVDLMGGRIWATGRKGEGTRMTFVLPLGIEPGTEQAVPEPSVLNGLRILLAVGGEGTRSTLSAKVERLGMQVRPASSRGEAALALAREGPFDAVLSDWDIGHEAGRLPGLTELSPPPIPLVLLLPLVHDQAAPPPGRPPAASLTKPVRHAELCGTLNRICGPSGS
ncbi:ATP-binding response regulator [Saccharibacillus deserti]|uniref:ATP-binding response regulator n=1 Tax=Saccharibacillus deserti TaxID=1634444 RepID=UPI0015561DCF|nr:ATP-binding protein [Saccharibacillus deserti]